MRLGSQPLILTAVAATFMSGVATAAPNSDLQSIQATLQALQARVAALESENAALRGGATSAVSGASNSNVKVNRTGSNSLAAFNPDIGVSADIVAAFTQSDEDEEGNDKLSVRELELLFGHDVDPYSRFDATIAFSDNEDPHLEEAFLTHWGLPGGTRAWIGRFHPRIGKIIGLHRDQLATVDEPLAVQQYFGPEGMSRTGVELANFLPLPWESVTHELAVGVLEGGVGHEGTLLGESRRHPTFYAHLKNFWEVSEATSVEVGGTYLLGSSDEDDGYEVRLYGVDVSADHYFDPIRKISFQAEAYFQNRSAGFVEPEEEAEAHAHSLSVRAEEADTEHEEEGHEEESEGLDLVLYRDSPLGLFGQVSYRFADRWSVGTRYDYVESINTLAEEVRRGEQAWNGFLTFQQTEFSRWRFQYQHVDLPEGGSDERFFLQGNFAIGVHKHRLS